MKSYIFESDNENTMHSYIFSQKAKPHAAIDSLLSVLLPFGKPFVVQPGEEFSLYTEQSSRIILLESGIFSICCSDRGLTVLSVFAPTLVGLLNIYDKNCDVPARPEHFLVAETECRCRAVSLADFIKVTDECNLWHDVARLLAYRLMIMNARDRELVGVDAYLKVRALLIEIWAYNEEYRQGINVLNFIHRRTGISRSRTMKLLSELRKGGYINIHGGRLLEVKNLPKAY
ncbi:helix-turn-helix domain-containing protein [Klebsiella quasipneumoniae]|uniref:winged helix-turn-helix transcriptional regulator n=1 Tax=Klebsiella quasipneumoniae TaxID=1463165 RepID=UPI00129A02EF|nr:winged helix-turn-helix transcriptional regulator [Klebsiella quasipneumoniae]MCS6746673.1 helix-turn-helix domain-containing protein [Klebsiella quasipneumoniae]MRE40029.1 cytoplasmic protein [Klebsiella quasipneumoniae]MRF90188.1 cytoplasmic protein [Klebsiella quasipneumoniae]HCI6434499.1 helix-turn-helix domain-containing protein [Klebsiella quasipneumoniae subsp. similipneumoniae]